MDMTFQDLEINCLFNYVKNRGNNLYLKKSAITYVKVQYDPRFEGDEVCSYQTFAETEVNTWPSFNDFRNYVEGRTNGKFKNRTNE